MQPSAINWISKSIHRHFEAMDAELRLASRMQRELLPPDRFEFGGRARFSALYKPCAWVSGDIIDILPLNDRTVAFYLADVAGHGVAAGLLTMFVKQAVFPRDLEAAGQPPMEPARVLANLNARLIAQQLRDSLFVTAWYGLLDTETMQLDYATAGHPPAIHVRDGNVSELHAEGGLLGLAEGTLFRGGTIQLAPQDRIVIYSDGVEGVLIGHRPPLPAIPQWHPDVPALLNGSTEEVLSGVESRLNSAPGSLNRGDDATVVVLDMGPFAGGQPGGRSMQSGGYDA